MIHSIHPREDFQPGLAATPTRVFCIYSVGGISSRWDRCSPRHCPGSRSPRPSARMVRVPVLLPGPNSDDIGAVSVRATQRRRPVPCHRPQPRATILSAWPRVIWRQSAPSRRRSTAGGADPSALDIGRAAGGEFTRRTQEFRPLLGSWK